MQHVPGDESRQAQAAGALRLDQQPQLRGAAGQRRPDAPDESRHGGRGGLFRRHLRRARLSVSGRRGRRSPHQRCRQPVQRVQDGEPAQPGCRHRPPGSVPVLPGRFFGWRGRRRPAQVYSPQGRRRPARHPEHRHRHDHPQGIPQDDQAIRARICRLCRTAIRQCRGGGHHRTGGRPAQGRLCAQPGRIQGRGRLHPHRWR
mmetsp:Transcript_17854/g.42192  ORF Transcript_17854/g.42192 Transcript_17854/m.42192 type:complete len:202 (+) Transcript_17854:1475-2080(+)